MATFHGERNRRACIAPHPSRRSELSRILSEGSARLAISPDPERDTRLEALATLTASWGTRINLTGHRTADDVARHLILDALALHTVLPPAASLVDLGSGAGFPGLPLAAARPSAHVLLVEARERRHHFQRAAIREMALANVRAVRGRFDEIPPVPASGVVAQAVAPAREILETALAWVEPGGWIGLPTGLRADDPPPHPRVKRSTWILYGEAGHRVWVGHT